MTDRRADLLAVLHAHEPGGSREARSVARTIALVRWLPEPFDEKADPVHVTASAVITDEHDRVLLHRHRRLGIWLQPGGHIEAGEAPAEAAVREAHEETGIAAEHPPGGAQLVHVDVHEGPRGHVHLDVRYLLRASAGARLAPAAGESPDVAWFPLDEALQVADESLAGALRSSWGR